MKENGNFQLSALNSQLIPPGYKQTEVGVIPEDREVKTLGAVISKGRLGGKGCFIDIHGDRC